MLDLVFFRVEIFLAAGVARARFEQFKRRAIDAVVSAESRGEQRNRDHKRRAAAELEILAQDIGRVRPQVGTKIFAHFGLGELA